MPQRNGVAVRTGDRLTSAWQPTGAAAADVAAQIQAMPEVCPTPPTCEALGHRAAWSKPCSSSSQPPGARCGGLGDQMADRVQPIGPEVSARAGSCFNAGRCGSPSAM
jgi:hypothetical protein